MVRKDARKQQNEQGRPDKRPETRTRGGSVPASGGGRPEGAGARSSGGGAGLWSRTWRVIKYALLLLCIPPFLNFASLHQEARYLKPDGEYYDVGFGQKLFMGCQGSGEPTVILDAPTGMSLMFGRSYNQHWPRSLRCASMTELALDLVTALEMADDFRRLFTQSSQQARPFILVGSELGAVVARFYTQIYETDVSDLVLIDPLVEDIFHQDSSVWKSFWFDHLIPSFQTMQLAAAVGITRLLLLLGAMETPISGENLPEQVVQRQKYLMCNPRHLSTVVDEHHFINETFSQIHTALLMKAFPSNVSVTVVTGNYYDEQLPSVLNKAWAKSQQTLISRLHPGSKHIVVNGADHRLLYRKPDAIIEPIRRLIKHRREQKKHVTSSQQ